MLVLYIRSVCVWCYCAVCNCSTVPAADLIQSTLRKDGNVLLPIDTAGRVLELAQLLVRGQQVDLCVY